MKHTLPAFVPVLAVAGFSAVAYDMPSFHGRGFFPVVVQVIDPETVTPVKGAKVRLEGLPEYLEAGTDPAKHVKVLPQSLGKPVTTNAEGVAVVFYYGAWSEDHTDDGQKTYERSLVGTVVVELDGREIHRANLAEWAKKNRVEVGARTAPYMFVTTPKAK